MGRRRFRKGECWTLESIADKREPWLTRNRDNLHRPQLRAAPTIYTLLQIFAVPHAETSLIIVLLRCNRLLMPKTRK